MREQITIGGRVFLAETAAISCLRYRSKYGVSPLTELQTADNPTEMLARLVQLVWVMVQPADMTFRQFADMCRNDPGFANQALVLRGELLKRDDRYKPASKAESLKPEDFDEFDVAARLVHAGLGTGLLYDLPLFQLISVMNRTFDYKNQDAKGGAIKVRMSPQEVSQMLLGRG